MTMVHDTDINGGDCIDQMAARFETGGLDAATRKGPADIKYPEGRQVQLTWASAIEMMPVCWLWAGRIPLGELSLLAGREGIGKYTVAFQLAARITQGKMKGEFYGQPKSVFIAATEDSWEHTIVPRLKGAGADLNHVARIDVVTKEGALSTLTLPKDVKALHAATVENDVKLLLLDPLMSRLSSSLDSHRDAEVRQALEPLTGLAKATDCAVLGLIHVNKSAGTDPLNAIMGSRAFPAVARAVLVAMKDPTDEKRILLGLEKSNLGSTDIPTIMYEIKSTHVGGTDEKPIITGVVNWLGDSSKSITEAMETIAGGEVTGAVDEAGDWLEDYLTAALGPVNSYEIKKDAKKVGISESALHRARKRLDVRSTSSGFPRQSFWELGQKAVKPF